MLNLLPLKKKREIEKEYKVRRIILILIFLSIMVFIWITFLLPTFLLTKSKFDELNKSEVALTSELDFQKNKETNFTDKQEAMLNVLQNSEATSSPTMFLDAILQSKGSSISITDFSIVNSGGLNQLLIHGKALTREDLITFQQTLEKNSLWSKVDLPISNLGPAKNNVFSITLTINQNK